jgi:YD repeat-containing protein
VTDFQGIERYSYDVRGRTLKSFRQLTFNNKNYTNQFTFDSADRLSSIVYTTGGPTVTNLFDAGGHLTTVQRVDGTNVYYQAAGFNEANQLLGVNFGNGTATTYGYFPYSKRLQSIATKKSGASTNFQSLSYTFNAVADLTSITDGSYTNGTNSATLSSIGYDNLHRLTSLTRPGPATTSFGYDRIGNITSNGEEGGSTYTYNSNGLLAHAVKTVGSKQYAYDLCGNLVFRNGQRLDYDAENRLSTVVKNGLAVATFGYADDGERLWKQGTNTLFVWIGNCFESWGTTNLYHILAGSRRVATYSPATKLPGASGNIEYHYYHPDHLGSSSLLSDSTGAVAEHYEYTAYGRDRKLLINCVRPGLMPKTMLLSSRRSRLLRDFWKSRI